MTPAETRTILICTVGGSHQPIVTAIRDLQPDFVSFVCSGKDPGTGRPGSDTQIAGTGSVIKVQPTDERASLPNIPTQVGLPAEAFEIVLVPTDDLDGAVAAIRTALAGLRQRFPGARLVADYTGGTKTMTAALIIEALEHDDVELHLVTGNRANLVKVQDGTEACAPAIADAVRLGRAMTPYLAAWSRFAYDEAAAGLARLALPRNSALRARLARARDLSQAFAAWDRFEHGEALRLLDPYAPVVSRELGRHLGVLRPLTGKSEQREPLALFDLWHNAQRRAAQGRYDDAVARAYRLLEWTAQWLLRRHCGLDTGDLPAGGLPPDLDLTPGRDGKIQAGLYSAWRLVEKLCTESAGQRFAAAQLPALLGHVQTRNLSILAHGFTPIGQQAWARFRDWLAANLVPMLLEEAKPLRLHSLPPQLPDRYQWQD
ncbi:MAG: TIGR02710 family CRISPR-associated CARF protein [Candidatus Latescibacterota bacterium]